jgi:hypothetical protein
MRGAQRLAVGLLAGTSLVTLSGCGAELEAVPPISQQIVIILDVSGSTAAAAKSYPARVQGILSDDVNGTLDGSRVVIAVADGASQGSTCIPVVANVQGTGSSKTLRKDKLAADTRHAVEAVTAQVKCGLKTNTPGSDLLGSLLAAAHSSQSQMASTRILVFSDGMQSGPDLKFTKKLLRNNRMLKSTIKDLAAKGLIVAQASNTCLTISDPAVGAKLTAQEATGVTTFWSDYAQNAKASYSTELKRSC